MVHFFPFAEGCILCFILSLPFASSDKYLSQFEHIPYVTYGNAGKKLPFLDPSHLGGVGEWRQKREVLIPKII